MPLERSVVNVIVGSMKQEGWELSKPLLSAGDTTNPVRLLFHTDEEVLDLIIYATKITKQGKQHNRPADEYHAQMLYDDTKLRVQNFLQREEGAVTLVLGYYPMDGNYLFVGFDPYHYHSFRYSNSLQLREPKLLSAAKNGIAFQSKRTSPEPTQAVIFRAEFFDHYVRNLDNFHAVTSEFVFEEFVNQDVDSETLDAIEPPDSGEVKYPELSPSQRKKVVENTSRWHRDAKFTKAIRLVYDRCAICDFQYGDVLDGAHIIPVRDPASTDTYDNGMGLCPRCHRMYDRGYILVNGFYQISLNPTSKERFKKKGQTGSLSDLENKLRATLWLPENEEHRPSPAKLQLIYQKRSK